MALTQVKTTGLADDAVTTDKLANAINTERTANTAKTSLEDNSVTLAKLAGGTDGQIITYDANGDPVAVGPGTDGQVLTSTGAGSPPAFEDAAAGGAALTGSTNNTITTVTGANAITGEANLTYDGTSLEVKTGSFKVWGTEGNDAEIRLFADEGDDNADAWSILSTASDNKLKFRNATSGSYVEKLTLDSNGRVGIGTTTIDKNDHSLLNVHRSTSDSNYMYFTNSTTGETGADGFTIGLDGTENALIWNRENTDMRFGTNATERMTILAAGGLTFNGDSAAANALSDYEEGTFSPLLRTNGDTTGQATGSGTYVKIGRAVHIHVLFGNKTLTSLPTGDIAVVSLPFVANQTQGDEFGMSSKMVVMGVDSNSTHGYFRTGNGSAAALGYFNQDGSTWAQWSTTQWDNSGVYLIFNMTYFTNS